MKPTLIIMAAGVGRRFGGLKQIEPVGASGELIIDYSIYDAVRAGFGKIIFVVSKAIEKNFKERIGDRVSRVVNTEYAYQSLDDLPGGFLPPRGREKPWGTAHAVYSCRHLIDGPFAAINADDFYGVGAFDVTAEFLSVHNTGANAGGAEYACCMAGYKIEDTMSGNGYVARGICDVTKDGFLAGVTERTRIEYRDGGVAYTEDGAAYIPIARGTVVSLNMWGFPQAVTGEFESRFLRFLSRDGADLLKDEFFLPAVVNELIESRQASVKVLESGSKWYGVTYREDRESVKKAIADMTDSGVYPRALWKG